MLKNNYVTNVEELPCRQKGKMTQKTKEMSFRGVFGENSGSFRRKEYSAYNPFRM